MPPPIRLTLVPPLTPPAAAVRPGFAVVPAIGSSSTVFRRHDTTEPPHKPLIQRVLEGIYKSRQEAKNRQPLTRKKFTSLMKRLLKNIDEASVSACGNEVLKEGDELHARLGSELLAFLARLYPEKMNRSAVFGLASHGLSRPEPEVSLYSAEALGCIARFEPAQRDSLLTPEVVELIIQKGLNHPAPVTAMLCSDTAAFLSEYYPSIFTPRAVETIRALARDHSNYWVRGLLDKAAVRLPSASLT